MASSEIPHNAPNAHTSQLIVSLLFPSVLACHPSWGVRFDLAPLTLEHVPVFI